MLFKNKILNLILKINSFLSPKNKFNKRTLRYLLYEKSINDSLEFISKNMTNSQVFETREGLYSWCFDRITKKGLILEFGVHNGNSINYLANLTDEIIHGFDSFEGLPSDGIIPKFNDGATKWFEGKMTNFGNEPNVRKNVKLYKGWFDKTLPVFYKDNKNFISLMHIDCDIYSSTKTVLNCSKKNIKKGTIIIFDEFLNYEGWQNNEYRAFIEFTKNNKIKYTFIAYSYLGGVAVKIS